MKNIKQSLLLSSLCWISVILLLWLAVLDIVPLDWLRIGAWLFFFFTGVVTAALASSKK